MTLILAFALVAAVAAGLCRARRAATLPVVE